ncbi:MAG: hypothetical protein E7359_04255 [Clostridiales bacterium]|nr:hypothetical protein [Clostridiales bacterium]
MVTLAYMNGGHGPDYLVAYGFGLKDEKGKVIVKPSYEIGEKKNGVFVLAGNKTSYITTEQNIYNYVDYYNENGDKLNNVEIIEGSNFNEDGFAVVAPSDINYTNGAKYVLMTKKGNMLGMPTIEMEDAKLTSPADLEQAIKDCGALAVKYATAEVIGREKVTTGETFIEEYKEALKKYLKGLDYSNISEKQAKTIVKKELTLFKELIDNQMKIVNKQKKEKAKKSKLNDFINGL